MISHTNGHPRRRARAAHGDVHGLPSCTGARGTKGLSETMDDVPNQCVFFLHGDMVLLMENVDFLWLLLGKCGFTNRTCGLL